MMYHIVFREENLNTGQIKFIRTFSQFTGTKEDLEKDLHKFVKMENGDIRRWAIVVPETFMPKTISPMYHNFR